MYLPKTLQSREEGWSALFRPSTLSLQKNKIWADDETFPFWGTDFHQFKLHVQTLGFQNVRNDGIQDFWWNPRFSLKNYPGRIRFPPEKAWLFWGPKHPCVIQVQTLPFKGPRILRSNELKGIGSFCSTKNDEKKIAWKKIDGQIQRSHLAFLFRYIVTKKPNLYRPGKENGGKI